MVHLPQGGQIALRKDHTCLLHFRGDLGLFGTALFFNVRQGCLSLSHFERLADVMGQIARAGRGTIGRRDCACHILYPITEY